ncbi:hypothetical protein CR513_22420, partial [Mucuna pruriens]
MLNREIKFKRVEDQLKSNNMQKVIKGLENKIIKEICEINPTTFWHRKKYEISLLYIKDFNERNIPTKARPIQMNKEYLEYCKKEIQKYLEKELIKPSKSPWSCTRFYVMKASKIERRAPRIQDSTIFSKFDMKSGYYQIGVREQDRYKTAFVVPFGHYEWNVMPQGLKNAPSEFQNIMNNIFNQYMDFSLVYLDDHLEKFIDIIKENGLVVSKKKIKIFHTKIRFLGYEINQGTIKPIQRSIEFGEKFSNEIKDKEQLQRFLGCINYIADFIPNIRTECAPLYKRLRKNPPEWDEEMTKAVIRIKTLVKKLPCLGIPNPKANLIVETDASDLGYGGILKQKLPKSLKEQVVKYHSGIWHPSQQKYSTIKKEILSIVLCVQKFQNDIFNKRFLIRTNCKVAPTVLTNDVQNLVSKHIFARWQALLTYKRRKKLSTRFPNQRFFTGFQMSEKTIKPTRKDHYGSPLGLPKIIKERDSTGSQAGSINTVKVPSQYGHEVVSQTSGSSSQYNYSLGTTIRPRPPNTLSNIVKNSTTKEQTTVTLVPSLNPLTKISNKFTHLEYHNVIIGPSKLNPYEDQYLEKNELLLVIVLERDQAKVSPIQITKTLFPPDFHYLPIHPYKTRTFYEFILVDTDCIGIFHTQDKQGNI